MKIRDFLTAQGNKDSDITYNNGNVMLRGKQFMSATPQADGSTYGNANQLSQAYNNYNARDEIDAFKANMNKPRQQFAYDANTDPLYQNALGAAQRSAQTAGNNASVRLGARGIGNSQQALTTENQIQQRAVADVNSNLLPQYMTQAYNQYKDRYAMDQDALKNQLNLAGTYNDLGQQGFNNDRLISADREKTKQSNLDASRLVGNDLGRILAPKDDWSNLYNQDDAPLNFDGRKYNDDMTQRAFENQYKTDAQAIQQQNANTSAARTTESASKPTKEEQAVAKKAEESAKKMESEKQGLIGALQNQEMSYSDAEKQIKSDLAVGFYTPEEASELLEVMKVWAANAYGQRWN